MEDLKKMEQQSATKSGGDMTGGLVMIGIGVAFLVMQFTDLRFDNWWVVFILIPVFAAWTKAFRQVREVGHWTNNAVRLVAGALFPLFVALIFLLGWDWGQVWPGFIILAGVNALAAGWRRD